MTYMSGFSITEYNMGHKMTDKVIIRQEKDEFGKEREYFFIANGHRSRIGDDIDQGTLFDRIIEKSECSEGDEVYLIEYREGYGGCHDIGWIVIFDVDDLFSKVFINGHDSIAEAVGSDPKETSIIAQFWALLDEKGIRYGEEWVRMD